MKTHSKNTFTLALLVASGSASFVLAGPLSPPPGAITSTYKTLTEVEPRTAISATNTPGDADSLFKITQPGSYYLTGNITGVVGKHGIEIAASDVTLDLGGFTLAGVAGSLDGVAVTTSGLRRMKIKNGTVRDWGDAGIDTDAAGALYVQVEDTRVHQNAGHGIAIDDSGTVLRCSAVDNGGSGIDLDSGAVVEACMVSRSIGTGINVGSGIVRRCHASFNDGVGIFVSNQQLVEECTTSSNGLDGIRVGSYVTVRGCSSRNDGRLTTTGAGIQVNGSINVIEDNDVVFADRGVSVAFARNKIVRNTCSLNTTDWFFVANNIYGTIVDRRSAITPAVSGFSAASSLGTTDPDANISY